MKIGITLNSYYEDFLKEIANLNGMSITSVCGLIVENFLSFNKKNKRFPLFQRQVNIVFANEKINKDSSVSSVVSSVSNPDKIDRRILNKEELLAQIEEEHLKDTEIVDDYLDVLPF